MKLLFPIIIVVLFGAGILQKNSMYSLPLSSIVFPPTPTRIPTATPMPTPTSVPSPTPTATPMPTPTSVPSPTPTPTPTAIPVSQTDFDRWFEQYAKEYSVDRMKLFALAACESMLKTNAVNGPYGGLYQFSTSTWISTRQTMNRDTNPDLRFHPEEAIRTAAYKISVNGFSPWPGCAKKINHE